MAKHLTVSTQLSVSFRADDNGMVMGDENIKAMEVALPDGGNALILVILPPDVTRPVHSATTGKVRYGYRALPFEGAQVQVQYYPVRDSDK